MKTATVIPASGIGDALLMMVASHRLLTSGYTVFTIHHKLQQLQEWFPGHHFMTFSDTTSLVEHLSSCDLVILQNDNTDKSRYLIDLFHQKKLPCLSVFYASYSPQKHAPLTPWDRIFFERQSMVDNVAHAIASLLQSTQVSKNNGISPPKYCTYHRYHDRIIIHPTSSHNKNSWPAEKFALVAASLQQAGYSLFFAMNPQEQTIPHLASLQEIIPFYQTPTLAVLAQLLYESEFFIGNDSGLGHLASNLQIPTLIVANCYKRMRLWRPGWRAGHVITPKRYIPNIKGWRYREKNWKKLISVSRVYKNCINLLKS